MLTDYCLKKKKKKPVRDTDYGGRQKHKYSLNKKQVNKVKWHKWEIIMVNGQSHIYVECLNLKLSVVKRQGTSSHPDHFFSQQSNPGWNVSGTAIHVRVARNLPIKAAAFYPEAGWTQWKALNITDMPFHVSEAVAWHISKLKKCIFDDNWSGACILKYI